MVTPPLRAAPLCRRPHRRGPHLRGPHHHAKVHTTAPGPGATLAVFAGALAGTGASVSISSLWTLFAGAAFSGAAFDRAVLDGASGALACSGDAFSGRSTCMSISHGSSSTASNGFICVVGRRRMEGGWTKSFTKPGSASPRAAAQAIARPAPSFTILAGDGGPASQSLPLLFRRLGVDDARCCAALFAGESDAFLDCPAHTGRTLFISAINSFVDMPLL